ncbi:MAG: hypothetical protein D6706_17990, partial [Chloroflexi bacterium]
TATTTATPVPPDLALFADNVFLYPVAAIYAGEKVTFEAVAYVPDNISPDSVNVSLLVDNTPIATSHLNGRNLAGESLVLFEWVWDSTDQIGRHEARLILDPEDQIQIGDENQANNTVDITFTVLDRKLAPPDEKTATWVQSETACCFVYTVTGTAANRDLAQLLPLVDKAFAQAVDRLNEEPDQKYTVYFIDRVIGQGGYAGSMMVVSYLDRQYAGNGLYQVLVHEAVHVLDREFAPQRIPFLAEGLAVWAAEGHYKPENILERTAALRQIGEYIPLAELVNNFYPVQHEIGYLEAAGLVNYLINTYGWATFRSFYMDVTADDAPTLAEAMDINLQIYYNRTLAQMEAEWLAFLDEVSVSETAVADLETTIRYYNVMRQYQAQYDPTAHFLKAWLPHPERVRELGNPADLNRHPRTLINITLEVMLQAADLSMREGNYDRAHIILDSVSRVLANKGLFMDPLALSYFQLVQAATDLGYTVQKVSLTGNRARIFVTRPGTEQLVELQWQLKNETWVLTN